MSRSYRKTKIFGIASWGSDKFGKRKANRALRRHVHQGEYHLILRDVSNPWNWSKDGKRYWRGATDADMRK